MNNLHVGSRARVGSLRHADSAIRGYAKLEARATLSDRARRRPAREIRRSARFPAEQRLTRLWRHNCDSRAGSARWS